MRKPLGRTLTSLTLGLVFFPTAARACAVCIGWIEDQGPNVGFYWSALLLTALPFALVAGIGVWLRRVTKAGSRSNVDRRTTG